MWIIHNNKAKIIKQYLTINLKWINQYGTINNK